MIEPKYTHLVLSGGGLSGMVYIGIYRFFKQHSVLKNLHYISGTSIGSLFGFLFGMDIECTYIEELFNDTLCTDNSCVEFNPNSILDMYKHNGIYSTERFRKYIVKFIKDKYAIEDITFAEYIRLTGIDLHIHTTCLNTYSFMDLCNDTFPDMSILTAILASMSVPFIFQPVQYKEYLFVDGGCCANMQIYDIVKNKYNRVMYIYLGIDTKYTNEEFNGNIILYGTAVMLSLMTSHTKKLIAEYSDTIDILEINESPIGFLNAEFKNNLFYATIKKEDFDEAIIFGYSEITKFLKSKGYF